MNKKKIAVIVSLIIIIIGGGALLMLIPKDKKEITEEDYKENPKYILEEVIVSEGKHFQYPKVKKVWGYGYQEKTCYVRGALELSKNQYNKVIKQLDNDLNIDRFEESEYKEKRINIELSARVYDEQGGDKWNTYNERKVIRAEDAEITYLIKVPDCKYKTQGSSGTIMGLLMVKKYDKYYMLFCNAPDYKWFAPKYGE